MTDDETAARGERPLSDQERADLYREQLKQLHVIDLVRDMMVTLVTVGYEKLGLTAQTRELRDLGDARVAIESLRRLIEVVDGEGDPEVASLRSTLAQMQLNFARASAEPRPSAAARPNAEAPRAEPEPPKAAEQRARADTDAERFEADAHAAVETEEQAAIASDEVLTSGRPAGQKTAAKKPAAKKPAAKPAAAKKPSAEKPSAKKSSPRKPGATRPPTSKPAAD